ncbi:hypothetical protein C2W64_01555 [Brevibacillus laterosporus]|nr:hypothetical protein C2W64_01555 [Brevibacillus laterosporus]
MKKLHKKIDSLTYRVYSLEDWNSGNSSKRGIEYVFIQARAGISLKEIKKQLQVA